MADSSERVIPATPRRRELARRRGMMPTSGLASWTAAAGVAVAAAPAWFAVTMPAAEDMLRQAIAGVARPTVAAPLGSAAVMVVLPTSALVIAAAAAGLGTRFLLDGVSWQPGRALPLFRRIDPFAGLGRIFSRRTCAGLAGAAGGLVVLLAAAGHGIGRLVAVVARADVTEPGAIAAAAWQAAAWLVAAAAAVSACQWLVARRRFERMIRMTPEEFAEESRGMQADPRIRLLQHARRRQPAGGA